MQYRYVVHLLIIVVKIISITIGINYIAYLLGRASPEGERRKRGEW